MFCANIKYTITIFPDMACLPLSTDPVFSVLLTEIQQLLFCGGNAAESGKAVKRIHRLPNGRTALFCLITCSISHTLKPYALNEQQKTPTSIQDEGARGATWFHRRPEALATSLINAVTGAPGLPYYSEEIRRNSTSDSGGDSGRRVIGSQHPPTFLNPNLPYSSPSMSVANHIMLNIITMTPTRVNNPDRFLQNCSPATRCLQMQNNRQQNLLHKIHNARPITTQQRITRTRGIPYNGLARRAQQYK